MARGRWNSIPSRANRETAALLDEKTYQGHPCHKGHPGTRLTKNGQCAGCYQEKLDKRKYLYGKRCQQPGYELLKEAKKRAKQYDREFDLDLEDIVIPENCPISGRPLRRYSPDAPSLDRINNAKGYVKGNIMVISHRMNTAKNDLTAAEATRLAEFMQAAELLE